MPSSTAKPMIMKPLASLMRITLVIAVSCVLPKLLPLTLKQIMLYQLRRAGLSLVRTDYGFQIQ